MIDGIKFDELVKKLKQTKWIISHYKHKLIHIFLQLLSLTILYYFILPNVKNNTEMFALVVSGFLQITTLGKLVSSSSKTSQELIQEHGLTDEAEKIENITPLNQQESRIYVLIKETRYGDQTDRKYQAQLLAKQLNMSRKLPHPTSLA